MIDLVCYNTRENCEYTVSGIPAADIVDACRMFCERLGYQYLYCAESQTHWAVSRTEFMEWYGRSKSPVPLAEECYERSVADVIAGRADEFRGLRQLWQYEPDVVAWDDLKP